MSSEEKCDTAMQEELKRAKPASLICSVVLVGIRELDVLESVIRMFLGTLYMANPAYLFDKEK